MVDGTLMPRRQFLRLAAAGGTAVFGGGLLAGCGSSDAGASSGGGKTLRLADNAPDGNPELLAEQFFAQRLNELSKGDLKLQVYGNATLGATDQTVEQVRSGTLEFSESAFAYMSAFEKKMSIGSMPYLFADQDHLYRAVDGRFGQAIDKLLQPKGFKVVYFANGGVRNLYETKEPFTTPAELKALNLRVRVQPDPVFIDTFNLLGTKTITMDFGQIYSSLQQHVIDGAENSIAYYMQGHHDEVAKSFCQTQHAFGMDMVVASLKWWNGLTGAQQKIVQQAAKDAEDRERQNLASQVADLTEKAKSGGVKITTCDVEAFRHTVAPIYDKYASRFGNLVDLARQAA